MAITRGQTRSDAVWSDLARLLGLSAREIQIVQGLLRDRGISEHTVRTYTRRIFRKLDVSSRCRVVIHALLVLRSDGLCCELLTLCGLCPLIE
ncbi:MAG: LuxR C-terminal-related transcriptional regulator [Thermoanaerobaculia bacterium]|jgi:DNA-binding CsgD family transcriptional regulator